MASIDNATIIYGAKQSASRVTKQANVTSGRSIDIQTTYIAVVSIIVSVESTVACAYRNPTLSHIPGSNSQINICRLDEVLVIMVVTQVVANIIQMLGSSYLPRIIRGTTTPGKLGVHGTGNQNYYDYQQQPWHEFHKTSLERVSLFS
jgi:hypothetical protein